MTLRDDTISDPAPAHSVGQEVRITARIGAPVVVTQMGMMAMNLVDTAMVGPLGAEPLAGVSVAGSVWFLFTSVLLGTVMALDPMMAQAFGAGRKRRMGRLLWQGTYLAALLGLPHTALFLRSAWLWRLLGQSPGVVAHADAYAAWLAPSIVPFLAFAAGRSFLNGLGRTRPAMWIALGANLLNLLADQLFIYGAFGLPGLGVAGAGLATTVVRLAMWAALLWVILQPRYRPFEVRPGPIEWPSCGRIVRFGLPIGLQMAAEVGAFSGAAVLAGWIGPQAQAAHQIALSLASFTFMMPLGLSMAASVRVGQEVGARRLDAAARAGWVALGLGAAIMGGSALVFVLAPEALVALFRPEPGVGALAIRLVRIAAVFQIADGLQIVAQGCLRGGGDTRTPLLANLVSHWLLGLPLAYLLAFPAGYGVVGIWYAFCGGLSAAALLLVGLFAFGPWRARAPLVA
ncbi:MAG: MATE family efflux transporter [Deltaproteobacteria bacterium]|nr:MAG: MATE family efflux transporter [Deltaproteobacteria bacterium]